MPIPEYLLARARLVAHLTGTRIVLRIPSILAEDEPFTLQIGLYDTNGLPVTDFPYALVFDNSQGISGLPDSVKLPSGEASLAIGGLRAGGTPVAFVGARIPGTGIELGDPVVRSNPAWVSPHPEMRLFWGDMHIHTRFSNCSGWRCLEPEWAYRYARDISLLDFAAPADHLRGIASDPGRWPQLQSLARQFNQPGRFVSFLGFESSHAQGFGGDNNVYFRDDDAPYFWLDRKDMRGGAPEVHLRDLWKQMDDTGKPYLTIPHHTGRADKFRTWDDPCHDPEREPLFEIYSSWGSSEMRHSRMPIYGGNNDAPAYFVDALRAGAHFGVMASSDDHATLPGAIHHYRVQPYARPHLDSFAHKGLTAIRARSLTREDLFEAMRNRRTYATTHAHSLIDFHLADAGMGERVPLDNSLRRKRTLQLRMTLDQASLAEVTLMRNGQPLDTRTLKAPNLGTDIISTTFEDTAAFDTTALRQTRYRDEPFVVYHARIRTATGDHQWTSPIWVDG